MQLCKRQLFLKFKDTLRKSLSLSPQRGVLGSIRRQKRYQFRSGWGAGSCHRSFESEPSLCVNNLQPTNSYCRTGWRTITS